MGYEFRYFCIICGKENVVTLDDLRARAPVYCQPGPGERQSACQREARRRNTQEWRKRKGRQS